MSGKLMPSLFVLSMGLSTGLGSLLLTGCSEDALGGCTSDSSCPSGHACVDQLCKQLCDADSDCQAGRYCKDAEYCTEGTRPATDAPVITNIDGNGSSDCVVETDNRCLGTAIVVSGQNLAGATFMLTPTAGASISLMASSEGAITDTVASLVPPTAGALSAGLYTLSVTNSVGTTQSSVELLQGEAGASGAMNGSEIVTAINNDASAGIISAEHLPAASAGAGASLYIYNNSNSLTDTKTTGDKMVVIVDAKNDKVNSVSIDDSRLQSLCADEDGCSVSVAVTSWYDLGYSSLLKAPVSGRACRFFLNSTDRQWTVSPGCRKEANPINIVLLGTHNVAAAPGTVDYGDDHAWINPLPGDYNSGEFGTDGNGSTDGDWTVLGFRRVCFFSESAPDPASTNGGFYSDQGDIGFHFFASYSSWDGSFPSANWDTASGRSCILTIED